MKTLYKRETSEEYFHDVAAGRVPGSSVVSMLGHNAAATTSRDTVWEEGGPYVFPPSASTMTISSSSTDDAAAGTGALTVLVNYLDSNWDEQTEILSLNGQSGVTTSEYYRVNLMTVLTTGSTNKNQGIIYIGTGAISSGKPATVYNLISTGDGLSHSAFYSVPRNFRLFLDRISISSESAKNVKFFIDQYVGTLGGTFISGAGYDAYQQIADINLEPSAPYPGKTDIVVETEVGTGTSDVRTNVAGVLEVTA